MLLRKVTEKNNLGLVSDGVCNSKAFPERILETYEPLIYV